MRRPLWLVLAVVLVFTALASAPRVRSAGDPPPQVVDTDPGRGAELPIDGSITFYFDQAMDRPSVESALKTAPAVKGAFQWTDDSTAIFHPSVALNRTTSYVFTIDGTAKAKTGLPLRDSFTLKLRTVGALEVTQVLPANNSRDVEATPTITVFFNRPVVPLLSVEDQQKLPSPITIQPAVDGTGEWLNTSIYTFKPKTPLQGGAPYTVTVNKGLKDITGNLLQNDVVFKFTAITARVIEFQPADKATDFDLDGKIIVTFSQPMDHTATEAAFTLTNNSDVTTKQPGNFTWNDKSTALTFKPNARLAYGTDYTVTIDNKKARSATNAPISALATAVFTTVAQPGILSTIPKNGDQGVQDTGFSFNFSGMLPLKDFKSRVTVDPKPGLVFDDYFDETSGNFYHVGFSEEPSTDYTVTLDTKGLVDKYGTPLNLDPQSAVYTIVGPNKIQIKFNTAAYQPAASLKANFVGLYSAYSPTTRVYTTHRNVDTLQLDLSALPFTDFMKLIEENNYEFASKYSPAPAKLLRHWELPVQNPPNVLRYDLLTITDKGPSTPTTAVSINCPGAPPTRLSVGVEVIVLSDDPRPINVRNAASTKNSKIINTAKPGVKFTIDQGPTCADSYIWWHVKTTDGSINGWIAEGDTKHYFVGPTGVGKPQLKATPAATPDNGTAAPLKPGAYWLMLSSPDLTDDRPLTHVMLVATANVTLKVSGTQILAWVTDLKSGQPMPNLDVKFYGAKQQSIGSAKTDNNGLAIMAMPQKVIIDNSLYNTQVYAVVNDGTNLAVAALNWEEGIRSFDFGQPGDYELKNITAYLYTDRSLYRPGQPVYYRGVLRSRNDMTYSLSELKTVFVQVTDNQQQVIYQKEVEVNSYGTFADNFTVDANAPLGDYSIEAVPGMPKGTDLKNYNGPRFTRTISVAQYRVPDFQVKLNADKDAVVQGDKIKVNVESSFFFGGAVSNAQIEWSVFADPYYFNYQGNGNYNFIDFNEDDFASERNSGNRSSIADGKGTTDAQGRFTIEIPADLGKAKQSQTFTIEARVIDESDQLIAGQIQVTVHQGEFYIGVAPEEYVGVAKQAQKIDLIAVNWDSKPQPNTDLSVRVVERVWTSVQTVEPGTGRTVWNVDVKETPFTDGVAHTDADGKALFTFTPDHGGIYKIYATSRDSRGNQVTSSGFLWVAGPDYVPWRQQNSDRIDLKIDRTDYKIGDTASVLIASPFQGAAKALVTVERGNILKTEVIDLPTNSTIYKLPITADMAPNAFVSITLIKGVDAKNPVPSFRMGMVQFSVNVDRLKLNISVTPDKPQAGPREQVNYKIKVTDYQNKPVKAEVGVGLTDLAVLSLLPDTSTAIMDHFYNKQGLGVRTGNALTISVDQQTQEIINTIKGGGGGGPEGGIFQVRQKFVDTPLWSPSVVTNDNGEATVPVTLPDNLTTWRLDARAVTLPTGELKTTLVGQTNFDLISTKPLLIRPVTPRFYVTGDKSTLVAIVNNNTGDDQDVKVRVDVKGATLTDAAEKTAKIVAKGRSRFEWPIEVQDVNAVSVTFFASTPDNKYTDAAKSAVGQGDDKTLPVYRYEVPETVGTAGSIDKQGGTQTEGIALPRTFTVTQGRLDIRLDRSLAASTVDALTVLKNAPEQDTEATVSRFLPNVETYAAFAKLKLDNAALKDSLKVEIEDALQRLYSEQHVDGGWGWFVRDDSNPLVTAYALIGLSAANKQGFTVDNAVINKAITYIKKNLATPGDQASTWQLNRQAFLLYALARADAATFSTAVRLFEIREKMSIFARAYLAMTIHLIDPQNTANVNPLISDLQNRAILSATGAHWQEDYEDAYNWNTDTRTTAIVLKALIDIQPTNPLIPNVVRWLMIARKADYWETRQETAWSIMALSDWMQVTGELNPNYTFDATLNDKSLSSETATPQNVRNAVKLQVSVKDLLAGQVNKLTVNRSGGDGILYYTAHLTAYLPVAEVKPLSRGFTISRSYSLDGDKDHKTITQAHVGDNIRVTLTIVVPNDLQYLVINDPIPAGTEAINPNLATSAIGKAPQLNLVDPFSNGWGWWWFEDPELRDDRTVLYATYLPRGTYEYTYTLRAGLAGQYQVIPTTGQETYFPEVYARSAGTVFTLLPAVSGNDPTDTTPAVATPAATAAAK